MISKQFKFGSTNYNVDIQPGNSIVVQRTDAVVEPPTHFVIGDEAEYDSYNLSYTGKIVSITEKTVTIQPRFGNKKTRLKIEEFAWRNWKFDSVEIAKKNSDTMMYI